MDKSIYIIKTRKELWEEAKIRAGQIAPPIPEYLERVSDFGNMPTFVHHRLKGLSKILYWLKNRNYIVKDIDEDLMDYRIKYENLIKDREAYFQKVHSMVFDALIQERDYYIKYPETSSYKTEESENYKLFKSKGSTNP